MRARTVTLLVLASAAVLPLVGDAGIPIPAASRAACCNTADVPPPPAPVGDEQFFKIPGGVPNIMLLVDNSGSMQALPDDIAYPTWSSDNTFRGTCSGHFLNSKTPFSSPGVPDTTRVPYDNGYNTGVGTFETVDNPTWGLTRCTVKQTKPAGDAATDYCLFRSDGYYKQRGGTGLWDDTTAKIFTANPCGAIRNTTGNFDTDFAGAIVKANDAAGCQTCLDTVGFYVFNPRYRSGGTAASPTYSTGDDQVVFAGWFLNAYPPKYVAARKVVKDLIRLDTTPRPNTDTVRFGLTSFTTSSNTYGYSTSLRAGDGGQLVVPLGPNCDQSFPVDRAAFAKTRQVIIDAVNATAADWSTATYLPFGNSTPLAESLFNIGQYFSNTGNTSLYNTLFGASWVRSSFAEDASGAVGSTVADWTGAGKNQHSFCWACQQASVIVVTDGAPNSDSNLPATPTPAANHTNFTVGSISDFRKWSNATVDCPTCGNDLCSAGCTPSTVPNTLHKVAYFLNQTDLRPDMSNASRSQTIATYTISFGIPATDTAPLALLQKTATLGGGIFANTSSASELAAALDVAVSDVVSRATSFSSANANSMQTSKSTSADAYLGRFRPTNSSMWEGHLYAATLFDEFGQGCDERFGTAGQKTFACGAYTNQNPNLNGDQDASGNAICASSWLVDADCDPIVEDATGTFKKGHFDASTHALITDPDDASVWWDAGKALSDPANPGYRSAQEGLSGAVKSRSIWTVIDVNANGKFDGPSVGQPNGEVVEFTAANASALAPLMNLPALGQASAAALPSAGSPAVVPWCNTWLNQIGVCGLSPLPACPATAAAVQTKCAEQIIHFYRGYDTMDWDNDHCAAPGNYYNTNGWGTCTTNAQCGSAATCTSGKCVNTSCANGEQRDRVNDSRSLAAQEFWKLGDVFHSSPVLVKPPVSKLLCQFGVDNQCLITLYSETANETVTVTPIAKTGALDAYDVWRAATFGRQQAVLVGANDGMLHAFDAGVPDTTKPADSEGKRPYTSGTGAELWAFVPPDMLPKLRNGLSSHAYFVDGNTMIRDVWVDANNDGTKQSGEYHTVAIITERGGGQRWTALDVTDPALPPKFLWTFPELCTEDSKLAGQSWADFLPRPPPIGPVRLALAGGAANDPLNRGFEERWVTMLNGGYDPTLVRGRVVWMVDVWTGKLLWRYTDADLKAMRGDSKASLMPVIGSIAMLDIGQADRTAGLAQTDTFFDTATWTDMGGNLYVARMFAPGTVDAGTGLVTNWTVGRAFEPNRQVDDTQKVASRGESFYMTANVLDGPGRLLTSWGTGNHENLMQQTAACGPNNVIGCCMSGCSVVSSTSATSYGSGSCSQGGSFQCSGGALTYTPASTSNCGTQTAPHACGTFTQSVTLSFSCGAAGTPAPITASVSCDSSGICSTDTGFTSSSFSTTVLAQPMPQYRFQSVWSYGKSALKRFTNVTEAKAFDDQRFTDVAFSSATKCNSVPANSCLLVETSSALLKDSGSGLAFTCRDGSGKCQANRDDPGWMLTYGKWCPAETCATATWTDEKTGNSPLQFMGCESWSTFRPTGASGGTDPCTSSSGTPTSSTYVIDAKTGAPSTQCGNKDTTPNLAYYAATQATAYAPPQAPSMRLAVNDKGQVNYSTLRVETGSGATKTNLATRKNTGDPLYWLEVPREVHTCRHVDPTTCK